MKKSIKRLYKNQGGNALILVILLTLCMFLIVGAIMAVSFSHFEISQAYKNTSNLYYAAQSGAEKMVDNLNKILIEKRFEIIKEVADEYKEKIESGEYGVLDYELDYENGFNSYDGEFLLKDVYESIKEEAFDKIEENMEDDKIEFQYELTDEKNKSEVTVVLTSKKDEENKTVGFEVLSTAVLKNKEEEEISKITLEGNIDLSNIDYKGLLLEEYNWKDGNIPNTFRSPILTFGDLVVTNEAKVAINGDVRARGYLPPDKNDDGSYPELEEYGGIYASHGGDLTIDGNAITLANLHTIKEYNDDRETKIEVKNDVFANSVVIEDDYPYFNQYGTPNNRSISARVTGQKILIDGDVYVDNDIAIDRYVKNDQIYIKGNVFGITNIDVKEIEDPNPNKASGIYAMGENTKIKIDGNAFVHGQAFISFDGGKNFSKLYESMGEPFEDVSFLDAYSPENYKAEGDSRYLDLRKDAINKDKIKLNINNYFYAPAKISANGILYDGYPYESAKNPIKTHDEFDESEELSALFNMGNDNKNNSKSLTEEGLYTINSNWNAKIIDKSDYNIIDIIKDAYDYLNGEEENINPFKRNYFISGEDKYDSAYNYRGIEGYMFIKRDIFYKGLKGGPTFEPEEMEFDKDIINSDITIDNTEWDKDNPLYVLETSLGNNIPINVSEFYDEEGPINTIIIDKGNGSITLYASDESKATFNGIVVSSGKVVIDGVENFNGIIISKGQQEEKGKIYTQDLAEGKYAGVLIESDVTINYDKDILFNTIFKDKSLKRLVFDYLGLTSYYVANDDDIEKNIVEEILKPSIDFEQVQKVGFDSKSVIEINQTSDDNKLLQFELTSLYQTD
ncbi:TadE/TadG family type IV pilus assembly protein [Defluviitalea phaphyphila]|uniref:TadE/TadG family type IV pilus assembly protein n=1 Tax=Defluviitalea phaphyphila TaxID=1473580 RepID=UPI0007301B43|nr:hypothetical protein [Defluviitalea phaphyphila]